MQKINGSGQKKNFETFCFLRYYKIKKTFSNIFQHFN